MTTFTFRHTNLFVTFFEILVVSFTLNCCLVFFKRKLTVFAVKDNIYMKNIIKKARNDTTDNNNKNIFTRNREMKMFLSQLHCVKSVRIWSYSGPHFPVFGLNTERYSLRTQSECGKMRTRVTSNTDTFYAMLMFNFASMQILQWGW